MNNQTPSLEEQKLEFAEAFIKAISTKSVEACKKLIASYDERVLMFSKDAIGSEQDYDELLNDQCSRYFNYADSFLGAHKKDINTGNIDTAQIHNLGGEVEINEGCLFRKIPFFSISMNKQKQENYRQSHIEFRIDDAFVINGRICINNIAMMNQHEITGLDKQTINSEFSSSVCSIESYKNLLERLPHLPQLESLQESDLIKVYKSDTALNTHLSLEAYNEDDFTPNGEGIFDAIFVLGSLTVKGNIFNRSPNSGLTLYVDENCQTDNVNTGGSLIKIENALTIKNICISNKMGYLQAEKMVCPITYGENIWCDDIEGIDGWELAEIKALNEKVLIKMICNGDSMDKEVKKLFEDA